MDKKLTGPAAALPLVIGVVANLATAPAAVPPGGRAIVTRDATMMPGPPAGGTAVATVPKGATVTVLEQDWLYVQAGDGTTGWLNARDLSSSKPGTQPSPQAATEAITNPECPPVGTHKVGGQPTPYAANSDAGLRNMAKRHVPASGTPTTLTLAQFATLQDDIDAAFADAATTKTKFEPNRDGLRDLAAGPGKVSEGDPVQLAGFVTIARNEGSESVNCAGTDGTDIHISIGDQGGDEYSGIVAEMIPQLSRPVGWDAATLNRIHDESLPVLVVGGLTYDNEHLVNKDSRHPKSGQPKRMSLWEIHPITEFYVCVDRDGCDPASHDQWVPLAEWAAAQPQ